LLECESPLHQGLDVRPLLGKHPRQQVLEVLVVTHLVKPGILDAAARVWLRRSTSSPVSRCRRSLPQYAASKRPPYREGTPR
jgi:hypothetical protein